MPATRLARAPIAGLALLVAGGCGAQGGAQDRSKDGDVPRLTGLSEPQVLQRFGPPERRRTDEPATLLFYDRARLNALRQGRTPAVQGGKQGMDASLACYTTLRLKDGVVVATGEAGAC